MILVTGASGFIGGHLVEALAARQCAFRCLVRRGDCRLAGEIVRADLSTGKGLDQALAGVKIIIHLAGATKALQVSDYYVNNVQATEILARAVAGRNIRLVHVSSLAAVGPSPDGVPLAENAPPHPLTHYGKSKLQAENSVRAFLPDAVILRPAVVYGPRDTGVLQVLKPLSKGFALEIGGGERCFSAIYVKDLVEGLLAAAFAPVAAGRSYFIAHPKPVTWTELTAGAARIMERPVRAIRVPLPIARAIGLGAEMWSYATGRPGILSREKVLEAQCRWWTCDTGRAAVELGFEARTPLAEGLAQTLDWYKKAGWLRY